MWLLGNRKECSSRSYGLGSGTASNGYVRRWLICIFSALRSERFRYVADKTASERSSKSSEMNSYISMYDEDETLRCELVVIPGRRKYWKWVDYGIADSSNAIIVIRPRLGDSSPSDLIVWLALMLVHRIRIVSIVLNNIDGLADDEVDEFERCIRKDFSSLITDGSVECRIIRLCADPTPTELSVLRDHSLCFTKPTITHSSPFSLSINAVHAKEGKVIVAGKVLGGSVSLNDPLVLLPPRIPVRVSSIHVTDGQNACTASAGQVVGIKIEGISRDHIETGMILCKDEAKLSGQSTRSFVADVNFFNLKFPAREGFCPVLSINCFQTLAKISKMDKPVANLGDTVACTFSLNKTAFVQVFQKQSPSPCSTIVLRQENVVIGVGVVRAVSD